MPDLEKIRQDFNEQLKKISSLESLRKLEVAFFGRKGRLAVVLKSIKDQPATDRGKIGRQANALKAELQEAFNHQLAQLSGPASQTSPAALLPDLTLPGVAPPVGSLHPLTRIKYELNDAFLSLGFEIYEGPEITSEAYAFDNLNFLPEHPARESMDTYWLKGMEKKSGAEKLCLRPHLTGASVRYLQNHQPPCRFVYPGRVFRSEATDASHERTFCQYEAMLVDKAVPFSVGRVLVNTILERVFGQPIKTRMRSGFFPFVEPGFEIDMQCQVCQGKGCSVCGQTGWVELMPGGAPHPNVLQAGGLDPDRWQGFYINIGLDRLVMMKYNITDIRLFRSADLRFLKQF